jgi:hypothetical protein
MSLISLEFEFFPNNREILNNSLNYYPKTWRLIYMFYFCYCTFFDEEELKVYAPNAVFVTKAKAVNHRVEFRAASDRNDRGWCHLNDTASARGYTALGLVYMFSEEASAADFDDFERAFMTVRGDDGNIYDCFTWRLSDPGIPMRPPNYYWEHIPKGLKAWNMPEEYITLVQKTFDEAAPCPEADRPKPSETPGKSADSR